MNITPEQYAADQLKRAFDHDIYPGGLLGLRFVNRHGKVVQLPLYVVSRSEPLPPNYATGIFGRLITKHLKQLPIHLEISDGHFGNAALAKAVGDMALEGEGYALSINESETGLPQNAIDVLTSNNVAHDLSIFEY